VRLYISTSRHMRVAKKSVKRAPNLQDLLCLTVFICIIYLPTILLRFRLPGLKSIYLLWEHHTKSLAESSYSLLRGSDFSLQISLPGVIPRKKGTVLLVLLDRVMVLNLDDSSTGHSVHCPKIKSRCSTP
jgi:hypothetical protein